MRYVIAGLVLALATSGCAAGTGQGTDSPEPTADPTEEAADTPTPVGTDDGDGSGGATIDAGPVPENIAAEVVAHAVDETGADEAEIEVVEAASVTWNDGSLGCPEPGMMYTQALEPGYQLILQVGEETLDYHISERGTFVLCPEGQSSEGQLSDS